MPRYTKPPLTRAELEQDGPLVRLRDLVAITGLSSATIRGDVASGELKGKKRNDAPNALYLFDRAEARAYVARMVDVQARSTGNTTREVEQSATT